MKKLFIGLTTLALTAFSLSATAYPGHQDNDRQGRRAQMMEKMLDKVGISDEQKTQIKSIRESYKPQLQQIRENGKSIREQKKALDPASSNYVASVQALFDQSSANRRQAITLKAQMKNEVANVLTAGQRAELKQLKEEFKAKRGERRAKRGKRRRF